VARETVVAAAIGVAAGCGVALMLARPLEAVLYGVRATDAVSYLWAGAMLVAVTALAALLPALRAARIDPIEVLRAE
jgi:ABC-type antimicrobial peptide transport system permease subunit